MFGGTRSRRSIASLCALLIGAAALTSCGSDDDGDSTAKEPRQFSAASEPPEVFVKRLSKLLATSSKPSDCAQLNAINQRSYVRFGCPIEKGLRKSMKSFKVVGIKEYGTGAVIDYKSGKVKDGAAIVLFVGTDRNWGISKFGVVTKPSTETSDEDSRESYEKAVEDYFAAVRDRDCEAYENVTFISPTTKTKDICAKLFAATEDMGERIKSHPDVEPRYDGGNASYGFFSYDTQKPEENSTISVIKSGDSALVLDVAPSPTLRQQRAVRDLARKQQKDGGGDQPETSPSKKAD